MEDYVQSFTCDGYCVLNTQFPSLARGFLRTVVRMICAQEAALPMSCNIGLEVNTVSILYPQKVSHTGYK